MDDDCLCFAAAVATEAPVAVMSQVCSPAADITAALTRWSGGDEAALRGVFPLLYDSLRAIARRRRQRHANAALDTTALVHEAYLSLAGRCPGSFADRGRFFAYVGCMMRSILVDSARRELSLKSGGDIQFVDIEDHLQVPTALRADEVLAVDRALTQLADADRDMLTVVELRYFAGMPVPEVADAMGLSPRSVDRLWQKARLVLALLL